MRKCLLVLLVLASFGVATVASAQEITVSGTTILKKKPEIASFHLSVQGKAKSGDKAQEAMITSIVAVQAALNNLRLEVSTLSYGITEDKANRRAPNGDYTTVVNGFIATTVYEVKVNDLAKLSKALEITSLPGVSKASYLEFDLRDRGAAEREARSAALKDAMANATAVANTAGKSAFDIVKIQQNNVDFRDMFQEISLPMDSIRTGGKGWDEESGNPRVMGMAAGLMGSVQFNDAIIIPGEMSVTASVVMMVKIK